MPERASVFNAVQIGRETTPGTAPVSGANRLLASMDLLPTPNIGVDIYRPNGIKYPTVAVAGKDLTLYQLSGKPTYTEIVYPLSSLLGAATITGPNADGAYTWTWNPSSTGADSFVSYQLQRGSSVGAEQSLFTIFSQLGLSFDRDRADLSGAAFGLAQSTGVTLTAAPTSLALVPISPKDLSLFVDTTSAGLGTTRMTRLLRGNWQFGQSKYNPLWAVDQTQASFAAIVESTPGAQFSALFEADTTGLGFLANVRAGDTRFVRIRANGPLIAGASSYTFTIDMAAKFGTPSQYRDEQGVYAIEYPWNLMHDPGWTRAMQVTLITTVSAL